MLASCPETVSLIWFILECDWISDVEQPVSLYCACYFSSARRRPTAPTARNAASAPPSSVGAERAARSVINKGGARLRARAPSRALRALRSLTRACPPTTRRRRCQRQHLLFLKKVWHRQNEYRLWHAVIPMSMSFIRHIGHVS